MRAVLFDFDYTLADSSDAIVECFGAGLAALGLPAAAPDAIRRTIGLPLPEALRALYVGDHRVDAEAASHAGIEFVAVLSGPSPRADFADHTVRAFLGSVADLPELLPALVAAR